SHVFLDRDANLEVANKVYKEFFADGNEPAGATVFVDWLPGGSHVEVTCIATTDLAGRKVVRPAGLKSGALEAAVAARPAVWAGAGVLHRGPDTLAHHEPLLIVAAGVSPAASSPRQARRPPPRCQDCDRPERLLNRLSWPARPPAHGGRLPGSCSRRR